MFQETVDAKKSSFGAGDSRSTLASVFSNTTHQMVTVWPSKMAIKWCQCHEMSDSIFIIFISSSLLQCILRTKWSLPRKDPLFYDPERDPLRLSAPPLPSPTDPRWPPRSPPRRWAPACHAMLKPSLHHPCSSISCFCRSIDIFNIFHRCFLSGKQIDMDMFGKKKRFQPPGTRSRAVLGASTAPIYPPPMASWIPGTFCAQDHPPPAAARKGHGTAGTASALDGSFVSENKGRPTGGKMMDMMVNNYKQL